MWHLICAFSELLEFISIVRILRLFKLTIHSPGLKILILASADQQEVLRHNLKMILRSSSRRFEPVPTSSVCSSSFSSSDLSSLRRSSSTSSDSSCPPAVQLKQRAASRLFHSDSGGPSSPWRPSATAIWLHALISACWWGQCALCLAYWRSTYPYRSSSTTSASSTRTLRRAPSCPRCVGA